MPRRPRSQILYDGCYAHVFSRSLRKQLIFRSQEDFEFFKSLLSRTKRSYGYRIYHYCLMNTHFHLAVSMAQQEDFSKALKEIKEVYSRRFNRRYGTEGPLWRGRFGSQLIENETYLLACGLYIERNPVQAGLVSKPEDWLHSSSRHYFLAETDSLVDPYDAPQRKKAQRVLKAIDFTRGRAIGSKLFLLHMAEGILRD